MNTPCRIAIAQVPMHWSLQDNLRRIEDAIALAQREGAALCAFAELALTGFHREVPALAQPALLTPALAAVQEACAKAGVAAALGCVTFGAAGERYNAHLFIDSAGALAGTVEKRGLTAPEATFFAAGSARPVVMLAGLRCSAVICREIEDSAVLHADLPPGSTDLLLWPGQMRPDPARPDEDPPSHIANAMALAQSLRTWIVQTNWPNALNRPEESPGCGASIVVSPQGEPMFRLPEQGFGVGVFSLGERSYSWHPA